MKELSLNILDITENSVKAEATKVLILLCESEETLSITIKDNGKGMTKEILENVENPFYTTRTTRKVGMGIPLFKMAAELCGGTFSIASKSKNEYPVDCGTTVTATFNKKHIDYTPLGDIISTLTTLIYAHSQKCEFLFKHNFGEKEVELDTQKLKVVLEDVPLNSFEVINWIKEYLKEQYSNFYK